MKSINFELTQILDEINTINFEINKTGSIDDINTLYRKIKIIDADIKKFNKTLDLINIVRNDVNIILNNQILKRSNKIIKSTAKKKQISSNKINTNMNIEYKNITNNEKYKNSEYAKCPVITISESDIDTIINTPIFYIKETEEYCIKINNKIIKGNIGNIISDKDPNKEKTNVCTKSNCNGMYYNTNCKFLHKNEVRNFPNYSWKYIDKNKIGKLSMKGNSTNIYNNDNENSRHIGSLHSLSDDLLLSNVNEKKLRNNQLMHDILLYQILSQYLI